MKKKKLILFTLEYPFLTGEQAFLEPELPWLSKKFDVLIVSNASGEKTGTCKAIKCANSKIRCVNIDNNEITFREKIFFCIKGIFSREFRNEIRAIFRSKTQITRKIVGSLSFYLYSYYYYKCFCKLDIVEENESFLGYSYWYDIQTMAMSFMKKSWSGIKIVTRTHGFDLYNERNICGRQAFKSYMESRLDTIFFISFAGKKYYMQHWGQNIKAAKLIVNRLGVAPQGTRNDVSEQHMFELVSCSNVIPIKRVELIVEALANIDAPYMIHWTHFGGGILLNQLREVASAKLGDNSDISYAILGRVDHNDIMNFYKKRPVDCFITTSSTEGVPVSIMEAMSYGIPIIGTDVGGVKETIDENGILISANPSVKEISEAIESIYNDNNYAKLHKRDASYRIWSSLYNSDYNEKKFAECLENIIGEDSE